MWMARAALRATEQAVEQAVGPVADPEPGEHAPGFAELYEATYSEMARLAVLLTGQRDGAHDIVQESFVKLHRAWDRAEHPKAYLRRIVVNECTTFHRRRFRQRRVQPLLVSDPVELHADEISDALAALQPRQRAAIVLRYWHDCSEQEIAEVLGCKP